MQETLKSEDLEERNWVSPTSFCSESLTVLRFHLNKCGRARGSVLAAVNLGAGNLCLKENGLCSKLFMLGVIFLLSPL